MVGRVSRTGIRPAYRLVIKFKLPKLTTMNKSTIKSPKKSTGFRKRFTNAARAEGLTDVAQIEARADELCSAYQRKTAAARTAKRLALKGRSEKLTAAVTAVLGDDLECLTSETQRALRRAAEVLGSSATSKGGTSKAEVAA